MRCPIKTVHNQFAFVSSSEGFTWRQLQDCHDCPRQPSERQFRGVAEHTDIRGPREEHQAESEAEPTQCELPRCTVPRHNIRTQRGGYPAQSAVGGGGIY